MKTTLIMRLSSMDALETDQVALPIKRPEAQLFGCNWRKVGDPSIEFRNESRHVRSAFVVVTQMSIRAIRSKFLNELVVGEVFVLAHVAPPFVAVLAFSIALGAE